MPGRPRPGEFALIRELFAPLAAGEPGALGLLDDAALIEPAPGCQLVAAVDMLVEGVHFLAADPAFQVAQKLLRVNLSDLASMGARPRAYLLGLAIAEAVDLDWLEEFARGLAADQARFAIALAGGDTTATTGPAVLSLTAIGEVAPGTAMLRVERRRRRACLCLGHHRRCRAGPSGPEGRGYRARREPPRGRDCPLPPTGAEARSRRGAPRVLPPPTCRTV